MFIWAPEEEGIWPPGGASRWWLHHSLTALNAELEKRGSQLIIGRGPAAQALEELIVGSGAGAVYWNRRYEPAAVARDRELKSRLRVRGVMAQSFNGSLLFEPGTVLNASREPFRVFTAFWRACLTKPLPVAAQNAPRRLKSPEVWPESLSVAELELEPRVDWAGGLRETWQPGEAGAQAQLRRFRREALENYAAGRDKPATPGTSRLSPHLHFGEISPGDSSAPCAK